MMDYIKNINKIFLLMVIVTFIFSCTNTLKENIAEFIENNCKFKNNVGCVLDLNKFVKEKFNRIYIFGESTTEEEISEITGVKYKGDYISDDISRIIFLMNNRIVFEEDFEENLFEFDSSGEKIYQGWMVYRYYDTSKFMIVKIGNSYRLKPIIR